MPASASGTEIGEILAAYSGSNLDFGTAPDIQTREPILKSLKRFFGVLNESYLGDILRFVHNAGRYGEGNDVRVDTPAFIVGKKDELMGRTLKDGNAAFESMLDSLVKNGLSRDIAVGTVLNVSDTEIIPADPNVPDSSSSRDTTEYSFSNYYYGRKAETLSKAEQCSIVRGSTLPVEANR